MSDLTVLVLNFNTKDLTLTCLKSILSNHWKNETGVWVVDNASTDGSVKAIKEIFPQVTLIQNTDNLGFAKGNNVALKRINSRFCLLLNSDTEVLPGSLDNLVNFATEYDFAIASCKVVNQNSSFQPNSGELPSFGPLFLWLSGFDGILGGFHGLFSYQERNKNYYQNGRNVGWVSGSVMLIRSDVFKKIGFLDEQIFMYGEDVEFCLRAKRAGFKIGWTDQAEIVHLGGGSLKLPKLNQWEGEFRGLLYIYQKYYGNLASLSLRLLLYIFITVRMMAFLVLGKFNYAGTYAKIITKI